MKSSDKSNPFKISAVIKTVLFESNIIKGIILKIPKKVRILFVSLNDHGGKEKISIKAMVNINPFQPCISESCIKIKIGLNFYFTLCGASKGFMKALREGLKIGIFLAFLVTCRRFFRD